MTWLLSFVLATLTALLGAVGAGILGGLCVDWYRVPSREGASGYFVIFTALLGLAVSFIIGLVCSRIVAGGNSPTFLRALTLCLGVEFSLLLLAAGIAWIGADLPPKLNGRTLALEVEVRFRADVLAVEKEGAETSGYYITLTADGPRRYQLLAPLRLSDKTLGAGNVTVPASILLHTSDPGKSLGVGLGSHPAQYVRLALPSKPTRANMEWSPWIAAPTFGDLTPVPTAEAIALRYRVQFYVEPTPLPPAASA